MFVSMLSNPELFASPYIVTTGPRGEGNIVGKLRYLISVCPFQAFTGDVRLTPSPLVREGAQATRKSLAEASSIHQ